MPSGSVSHRLLILAVTKLPAGIDLVARREKVILDMARAPGFNATRMSEALKKSGEIH